mmetsp:Transcript_10298/g.26230  ORF Transcript_10298/g.26230 Transcript_10298/m.26230 type:complete len:227 (+) Transcript_10298:820-1500(+)
MAAAYRRAPPACTRAMHVREGSEAVGMVERKVTSWLVLRACPSARGPLTHFFLPFPFPLPLPLPFFFLFFSSSSRRSRSSSSLCHHTCKEGGALWGIRLPPDTHTYSRAQPLRPPCRDCGQVPVTSCNLARNAQCYRIRAGLHGGRTARGELMPRRGWPRRGKVHTWLAPRVEDTLKPGPRPLRHLPRLRMPRMPPIKTAQQQGLALPGRLVKPCTRRWNSCKVAA